MAYEALNNLGHAGSRVVIVLNDNGRSYAPTVSRLSTGLTYLRLSPSYVHVRERMRRTSAYDPGTRGLAYSEPARSHDRRARDRHAPPVLRGAGRALRRPHRRPRHRRHGTGPGQRRRPGTGPSSSTCSPRKAAATGPPRRTRSSACTTSRSAHRGGHRRAPIAPVTYTDAFTQRRARAAADPQAEVVAITAAMPGPTGLLPFQEAYPERFFDVGIAEQHAVTAAAGMAMDGPAARGGGVLHLLQPLLRPGQPGCRACTGCPSSSPSTAPASPGTTARATTGSSTCPSRLSIPGMTVFAPSSARGGRRHARDGLELAGPAPSVSRRHPLARRRRTWWAAACALAWCSAATGRCASWRSARCSTPPRRRRASWRPKASTSPCGTCGWCRRPTRRCWPTPPPHGLVVTVEDGLRVGGAGTFLVDAMRHVTGVDRTLSPVRILGVARPLHRPGQARHHPRRAGPRRPRGGQLGRPRLWPRSATASSSRRSPPDRPARAVSPPVAAGTETCSSLWAVEFNLADLFEAAADAFPEREYLVVDGRRLTYAQMEERANRLAHHLAAEGVGPGDHVGIYALEQRRMGRDRLGGVQAAGRVDQHQLPLRPRRAAIPVLQRRSRRPRPPTPVRPRRGHAPAGALRRCATSSSSTTTARSPIPATTPSTSRRRSPRAPPTRDFAPRSGDDRYILYTGGTTGMPKGVVWPHKNVFYRARRGHRRLDRRARRDAGTDGGEGSGGSVASQLPPRGPAHARCDRNGR